METQHILEKINKDKLIVLLLFIVALVAVGFVLKVAKPVILPLVIAWLLTFVLGPVVNAMTRIKIPLPITIILIIILLFGIVIGAVIFLQDRVFSIIAEFPKYEGKFALLSDELSKQLGASIPPEYNPLADFKISSAIHDMLGTVSGSLFALVSNLTMIVIFLVFLLLGKPYTKYKLERALSDNRAKQFANILFTISSDISRYLSTLMLISLSTGILIWLALTLIGVDFAYTWGAMAFLLNFIPTLGSIVASVPPILTAFVQYYPNLWPGILALIAITAIQMTIGNFIAPKILGDRLNLSPVVILLSLLFWGWLWGIVGALLAVPIASAIKIVCENIDELQPISVMMGSSRRFWKESQKEP